MFLDLLKEWHASRENHALTLQPRQSLSEIAEFSIVHGWSRMVVKLIGGQYLVLKVRQ